ncbi:hypothetical protein SEUCBS140593_006757 [Sporothrix eucalyptigena]|uniref:Extracellular serine-rich protein n=1 Tax=Sporothrix eucalyptigena TaxID=1812306 RepID=A0ABP0C819_9PEZI
MSLQLAIFASLVGMALSATTTATSTTPDHLDTTTTSVVSTPLATTTHLTSPTTLTISTKKTSTKSPTTTTKPPPSSTISTTTSPSSSTSLTSTTPASTISIAVGESGLSFTPNTVSAAVGDVLEFSFYPRNHSVALGTWDQACVPAASGGFFSGFIPLDNNASHLATFQVTVDTFNPMVFYCSAGRHCQEGMFGVVNPANGTNTTAANADDTLAAYAVMAKNASSSVSPKSVFGGTLAFNGTTINSTTNGTVCGRNSANITSATAWCIPYIPDISSGSAMLEQSLWSVMGVALAVCLL